MHKTLIIAEAGVNHNGDLNLAKKLIEVAAKAGADYVKFQTFQAKKLVTASAAQAEYQKKNSGGKVSTQFEMLRKLQLDLDAHQLLIEYCRKKGVKFLSSAFDLESIDLLHNLGIDLFKIPSGEITNLPYLEKVAKLGKPVILSTGMCTLGDIERAYNVLVGIGLSKKQITILQCNTEYPTPMEDVNLMAMTTIGQAFDINYGYSDHTLGIEIPLAAVALGAKVIEKHFTLNRNMDGPDHRASLEPDELQAMVSGIRNIEKALGSRIKKPSNSEVKNLSAARKSIHSARELKAGEILKETDLIIVRPGNGISPMEIKSFIGKKTTHAIKKGKLLNYEDVH